MMITMARPSGQPVEFVEDFKEVLHRPGDPVRCPDQDNIEPATAGVGHHLIEARPPGLRTADTVGVFVDDLETALTGHLAEVVELRFRMLIEGRHPHIEDGAFHPRRPFFCGVTLPCLETYCWMNSIRTVVISVPLAAVVALNALWRLTSTLMFTRFIPVPSFCFPI